MTHTTPAAVERFYFMSWGMAPSIGGTWVSHSDYAALSAQLEDAVATADDMEKEAHSAIALWGAALKDRDTTTAQIMADPNAVHINMLHGTIAKPTVNQIIHLYGADTLRAALAQLKEPKE